MSISNINKCELNMKKTTKEKFYNIRRFLIWSITIHKIQAFIYSLIKEYTDFNDFIQYVIIGIMALTLTIIWYLTGISKKNTLE